MRNSFSISVFASLMAFCLQVANLSAASAQDDNTVSAADSASFGSTTFASQPEVIGMKYRSTARITMQAGVAFQDTARQADGSGSVKGGSGAVLFELGRGLFSLELGGAYLEAPSSKTGLTHRYAGVPVFVRLNYIEQPSAALSLKLGAMPAYNVTDNKQFYDQATVDGEGTQRLPDNDVLMMAGLTGSAPITDSLSFVIDGTYYRGTRAVDRVGTLNEGMVAALGLRFSL